MTAPIVEECVKFIWVLVLVKIFKAKDLKSIFLIGICVGLGFQISEDITYIVTEAGNSINEVGPQVFTRISGALASHWLYTGLLSVGVFELVVKTKIINKGLSIFFIISPFFLHFLWNSPVNNSSLISSLLTAISLLLIIYCYRFLTDVCQ